MIVDETSYPNVVTPPSTVSQSAQHGAPHDEDQDSVSDSSESAEVPPTWASFRLTHLFILIPLSIITLLALAIPVVCLWYINGFDQLYPFFKTFLMPFTMGCLGFLACFGLKKSIPDGLIQLVTRRKHDPSFEPHHHHVPFDLALCLVVQVVLVEFLRFTVLINQGVPRPRRLSRHLLQADALKYSDRPRSCGALDIQFFVALWAGLGWSFLELLVLGGSEWIQQVLLYKHVLLHKGNEELKIETTPQRSASNFACRSSDPSLHNYYSPLSVHELDEQSRLRSADSIQTPTAAKFSTTAASLTPKPATRIKTNVQIGEGTYCVARNTQAMESGPGWVLEEEPVEGVESCRIAMESLERQSVENAIGLALWQVPWFIVWIWRLNSSLLTLALSLLIARGVFRIRGATTVMGPVGYLALAVIVKLVVVMLWSFQTKTIGLVRLTYLTLLICLGSFFSSLSLWGLLS